LAEWPVLERQRAFELGCIVDAPASRLVELATKEALGRNSAGWWECDLADDSLTWTAGVYRIFGFPDRVRIPRANAVACYAEESRTKMERLRSFAISNCRGFALDAQIRPASGAPEQWMRLIGTPVIEDGNVSRLQGLKILISPQGFTNR
jgi:hypothetical protein